MESFIIVVLGLTTAGDKLDHPTIRTSAEVLEHFRHVAFLYAEYDCRQSITSLVDLFTDHITRYYATLR